MNRYQNIALVTVLCIASTIAQSQTQLEELGEAPPDVTQDQQAQLPSAEQKLFDELKKEMEDARKKQSRLDGRLVEANVWLAALLTLTVIIIAIKITQNIRNLSQLEVKETLKGLSEKLDTLEKLRSGGLPPIVENISVCESPGKRFFNIAGRHLDASPEVSVDGQSCIVESYSYQRINAQFPQGFEHKSERLAVIVKTGAGSCMLSIKFPTTKVEITGPSVSASGGYTRIKGAGFTPGTKVWINVDPGKGQPYESGYVNDGLLIVDWPSGTRGENTELFVRREDEGEVQWDGIYQ